MKWIILLGLSSAVAAGVALTRPDDETDASRLEVQNESPTNDAAAKHRLIFSAGSVEGNQKDIPLQFEISGRLQSVDVVEGALVRKGDVLARLNADVWLHKLEESEANLALAEAHRDRLFNGARVETINVARAEVAAARVRVDHALNDLNRGEKLLKEQALSREAYEDYRFRYNLSVAEFNRVRAVAAEVEAPARSDDLKVAVAKIALARADVREAQAMLGKTRITAPVDGIILRVAMEPGQRISPDERDSRITMTNISKMRVRAFVEEFDALSVHVGQHAYVTAVGIPDVRFQGTVVFCAPYLVPKHLFNNKPGEHVDIKVREVVVVLDKPDDLVVGLPVEVFIDPSSMTSVSATSPVVPKQEHPRPAMLPHLHNVTH